jgi:predicted transcriptional regulator of viral defense system
MNLARIQLSELARAASGGLLSVDRAAEALGVSPHQAAMKLGRLERAGWLRRAQRGLYLVLPLEAKPESAPVPEDPWLLAHAVFAPCYIGGWTAAEHWGLTEQLFRSVFVVTAAPRRRQSETRLSTEFHIARAQVDQMEGTTLIWRGSQRIAASNRERTLIDGLVHPHWLGGIRHLAEILTTYRESEHFSVEKLLARARDHQVPGSAMKRLGFLAERLWPRETAVTDFASQHLSTGVIRLDPAVQSRGKMNTRWGLWVNVQVGKARVDS